MRKYLIVLLGIASLFAFSKCSNDKENIADTEKTGKLSENLQGQDKAWALVKKFAEKVNVNTSRAGVFDFSNLKITKTEKEIICVDDLRQNLVRNTETINTNVETYRFTFEKNGKNGFAIATNDERVNRVLAFVEEGYLSDTVNIPGMAYMVRRFRDVLAQDLDKYYTEGPQTYEFMQEWTLGPCLKTQWHTGEPYNNNYKTPSTPCVETDNGKYQASSTAISVAQCIANYPQDYDIPAALLKKHNIIQLVAQNKIYAWDTELAPKVAAFVKEFDPDKTTKFRCTGSSTEIADLGNALNTLGFGGSYTYYQNKHDIIWTFKCLRWDCPTVYGGLTRDFSQSEGWVVDGFWGMVNSNVTNIELTSVHCVFAFGGTGNGWYSNPSEPIDPNGKPIYNHGQYYHKMSLHFRPVCPWCVL